MKNLIAKTISQRWFRGASVTLMVWGVFFSYLIPHVFQETPAGIMAGVDYLWADWSLHSIFAGVFAYRPPLIWFTNHPVYSGIRFDYPFVADLISGLLMRVGWGLRYALVIPSVVESVFLAMAAYFFVWPELKSGRSAFTAVGLLLFTGGMGFARFTAHPVQSYTWCTSQGIWFGNVVLNEILPQRALTLGVPITLCIMRQLFDWDARGFRGVKQASRIVLGLLSGLLVVIHVHSLIALILLCALLFARRPRAAKDWIGFAAGAAIPCLVWYLTLHVGSDRVDFFRWYPGWMAYPPDSAGLNFVTFWMLNWGIFLPLSLFAAVRTRRLRSPIFLYGAFLFVFCNFVKVQPWAWDNTKLFTYSYLCLAVPVAEYLNRFLVSPQWHRKLLGGLCLLSLTLSAMLDFVPIFTKEPKVPMWSRHELDLGKRFRSVSKPEALVLTSTHHHHWVPAIAGRQILMGFVGWIASYGIRYESRQRDMQEMFAGTEETLRLLEKYHVDYAVIGPSESSEFHPNEDFFIKHFDVALESGETRVYRISGKAH